MHIDQSKLYVYVWQALRDCLLHYCYRSFTFKACCKTAFFDQLFLEDTRSQKKPCVYILQLFQRVCIHSLWYIASVSLAFPFILILILIVPNSFTFLIYKHHMFNYSLLYLLLDGFSCILYMKFHYIVCITYCISRKLQMEKWHE